jgi:hypothetical protein
MEIVCKTNSPRKLMCQLTTLGPTNLLVFHLPGLGFWTFMVFAFMFYVKIPFWPLCNQILANEYSCHIFILKDKLPLF